MLEDLLSRLRALRERHLHRVRRVVEERREACLRLEGGATALRAFCSNDYLGLAGEAAVAEALARGARRYGAGSGASALISGHHRAHARLEERFAALLAPHIPGAGALLFGTGYLANLGTIAALADRDTEVFSEALNHASLIDGIRLSRAPCRIYPHADTAALEAQLAASRAARKLIVTDAVFSMDGALAPLPRLLALAQAHDAWLLVDDAHGFGVLGEQGRGSLAHHALCSERIVYVGTLGKALGVAGAFVAAHASIIDWLVQRARPYVFSTAPPPALSVALETALDLALGTEGDARRARLARHVARWRARLVPSPWRLLPSTTPIQPLVIGHNEGTLAAAAALLERGYWVAGIRPPTVPEGTARLRVALSAAHSEADVDGLADAVNELAAAARAGAGRELAGT
jgi:8-amino-7-oxononanoate synthase